MLDASGTAPDYQDFAAIRTLLAATTVNPTVSTLVEVAATLGFRVTLEKMTKAERLEITEPMRKAAA